MTTLHERSMRYQGKSVRLQPGAERRRHRRHDLEQQGITVERCGEKSPARAFGHIVDLSAGGVRIRTPEQAVRPDCQLRVRLSLPPYAGICPFVDTSADEPQPARQWVGWMAVSRVQKVDHENFDIAGSLLDMEDIDRGMLGLYLSTQPLAA